MGCAVLNDFCHEIDRQLHVGAICNQTYRVVKSGWAVDLTCTLISNSLKLIDLHAKVEHVSRPALAIVATTCGVISTARIFQSIHYPFSEEFKQHCTQGNAGAIGTEAAFALGRLLSVLHFAEKLGFFSFEEWANRANQIGGSSAKAFVNTLTATQLMHGAFLIGCTGLVYQKIDGICRGENLVSNSFAVVSFTTDAALLALGLAQVTNPHMAAALGIVACTTGLVSFLTDDAANPVKDIGSSIGYHVTCVTKNMAKNANDIRAIVGSISASIGLVSLWMAVAEPFKNLGSTCEEANKGLGFLHVFHSFGEFAAGKATDSGLHCAGKIVLTFKNIIGFMQFLEQLAVISAGTCQGVVKDVAVKLEIVGHSLILTHNLFAFKDAVEQEGFQQALTWERGFDISKDVLKLAAISLTFAGSGIWIESARFVALLGVSGVHIGRAVHDHLTG